MEKIEQRRSSEQDQQSAENFSDFKPEHKYNLKVPGNSMKYSYSITNKQSIDSFRPQFGQGPFRENNGVDISEIGGLQKQNNMVSYTMKKEKVNSEKIFKKNRIQHYNVDELVGVNRQHATSLFKQAKPEYLDLSHGDLVSKNAGPNITNLADESMGVSKNLKGNVYSAFLNYPGVSHDENSKGSKRSNGVIYFDESSRDQIRNM